MAKGVWAIRCKVCCTTQYGPPHGTTCFICEQEGLKYCSNCEQILSVDAFYSRPDTGKRMSLCIDCYTNKRNNANKTRGDRALFVYRRNEQSRQAKQRKYATEEGRVCEIARCHERRSQLAGSYTPAELIECLDFFNNSCAYCGEASPLTVDHIIPIFAGGSNNIYNIVPACQRCNSSKQHHSIFDWFPSKEFYTPERLIRINQWFKIKGKEVVPNGFAKY